MFFAIKELVSRKKIGFKMTQMSSLKKIHRRVLIVDDDPTILDVLREYLKTIGLQSVCVGSGAEALEKFKKDHFDMVISDLMMEQMDGLALLEEIKRIDYDVIFIIITGYPSVESVIDAMKKGAKDYLIKPFQFDEIKIKVERALVEKAMSNQLKSNQGIMWSLIFSIPIWLILGIILAKLLK
jgi:two-component system response regulator PilR (NtrC family)